MLEKLTKEQTEAMAKYRDKWMKIVTSSTSEEFYSDFVNEKIKDAVTGMYAAAKKKIKREEIIITTSPIMACFVASAHACGKKGTPKTPIKWAGNNKKITGMNAVENFLNGYENPKEIVNNSSKFSNLIYWGIPDSGFCGFIDFFRNETDIKVDYSNMDHLNVITELTHLIIISEKFCVVSMRPKIFRNNGGAAIADGKPYIVWNDGIGLIA